MARKLGRRQLEIFEVMATGIDLVVKPPKDGGKRHSIQFTGETEVPAPNLNAVSIYEERKWISGSNPTKTGARKFRVTALAKKLVAGAEVEPEAEVEA